MYIGALEAWVVVGGGGGRGNGIELKVTDGSRFPSTVVVTA